MRFYLFLIDLLSAFFTRTTGALLIVAELRLKIIIFRASALVRYPWLNLMWTLIPQPITDSLKYVKNQKSPACIKTHLPWNLLPKEIQKEIKKPKV